jgi:hypothetical protein
MQWPSEVSNSPPINRCTHTDQGNPGDVRGAGDGPRASCQITWCAAVHPIPVFCLQTDLRPPVDDLRPAQVELHARNEHTNAIADAVCTPNMAAKRGLKPSQMYPHAISLHPSSPEDPQDHLPIDAPDQTSGHRGPSPRTSTSQPLPPSEGPEKTTPHRRTPALVVPNERHS